MIMSDIQKQADLRNIEGRLIGRYSRLFKLFLLIAILVIICVVIILLGITLGLGRNWASFGVNSWIVALCALFGVFIILELIFYFHFSSVRKKRIELGKPKPEFINGKRVYVFTYPKEREGGIFSKTYIDIDDNIVLRLRSLMIPPKELWSKKEE